jgi:hypothetical protein
MRGCIPYECVIPYAGDFPTNESELVSSSSSGFDRRYLSWMEDGIGVKVSVPLRVKSQRDGVYECHPDGKESSTIFRKISYNGKTSLIGRLQSFYFFY